MINNITSIFTNQLTIPGVSTTISVASGGTGGAFGGGVLSAASHIIWLVFIGMIVVWVALSIYAAYKLMSGSGDPGETEKGMSIVKNIWFGILAFFVFAMILSVLGAFMGFGNISEWSDNLAQCGPNMGFYFVEVENQIIEIEQSTSYIPGEYSVFCCNDEVQGAGGIKSYQNWVVMEQSNWDFYIISTSPSCNLQNTVEIK